MSREQELGLDKKRKKFDVREEYFVSLLPTLLKILSTISRVCPRVLETQCDESGGLGTEAHRAAKGLARMGRCANAAIKPAT